MPRNRIVARGKRLGGGFGGKETRASHVRVHIAVTCLLETVERNLNGISFRPSLQ